MNILIADDELRLRKVVAMFLRKSGHDVTEAVSAEQALELLKEKKPDIIVLDVRMSNMTGIEATEIIKNTPEFGKIPVILLTANATSEERESGMRAGASAYITKPFSPKDLLEKINELAIDR